MLLFKHEAALRVRSARCGDLTSTMATEGCWDPENEIQELSTLWEGCALYVCVFLEEHS